MKRYKVEYEHNGEDGFAIVCGEDYNDAKENFLCLYWEKETDTAPEINDVTPYLIYDEIHDERIRQITEEGYTLKHDDELKHGELAAAAVTYASPRVLEREIWPFRNPPKVKDTRRNLVRAAALLVAEIERLDRLSERGEIISERKIPWREGLQTDSFIFRLSKDFKEFDLRVIVEHKVLESGETSTDVRTGKDDFIPEKFRDLYFGGSSWKRGVKVDIDKLARGFVANYFWDYYILNGNEWIPASSWKWDIGWSRWF